jgi:uncharacterized protein YndB with AHSA1/START domain
MPGTVALVIAVLVAALLGFAATRPNAFRVQRSLAIQAPPQRIFNLIADFHQWGLWSPYEKIDPLMRKTFSGAESGRGAVYNWSGNSKAGEGCMEITSTAEPSKIVIKLDFLKPFEGHNTAEFTMQLAATSTKVTWAVYGPQSFLLKFLSIFMNMDKMLGKEFESGLANLKAISESQAVATTN